MTIIQHRRGTTTEWAASSYILEAGEIGVELDTTTTPDTVLGIKVGNGESLWGVLDYVGGTADGLLPAGGTAGQILSKVDGTDYNAQWIDEAPAASYTSTIKHEVKLGETISKGQAVYVSSANGTNMIVSKASNATEATSSKTMGLLETGGATNDFVNVITEGLLAGLDTSSATAGDPVWLGTSGNLIYGLASKPYAPAHLVFIGVVTRSHATQGEIFVRPQNGFEINEIHDILIATPADNEVLAYDSASGLWKNQTASEAGLATPSDITTAIANLVDSAPTTLDTLNELAAALGNDPSFATTIATALGNKQDQDNDLDAIAALTSTGILKRTGTDTWTLITDDSSNWNTAYTDRFKWDGAAVTDAIAGRTALGLGTMATQSSSSYALLSGANFTGNVNVTSATTTLDSKFLNSSGSGLRIVGAQAVSGGLPGVILSPYIDNVEQTSSQLYYANSGDKWVVESAFQSVGTLTATGGIAGASGKNMTVASLMPSAGTASSGVGVIMTAAATGYSPPTKRPNGDNLVAGDVWISW